MRKGFTLIELIVTVALISIIALSVIVAINPAKRVADAQDSRAQSDARGVGVVIESCLAYVDSTGAGNSAADCSTNALLITSTPPPKGGPFMRATISSVTLTTSGSIVCVYAKGSGSGATTHWFQYSTSTGSVTKITQAAAPSCS